MAESSQTDYRTMELETDLLASPYRTQTNWHVIAGAASCGKTTLLNLLAGQGFRTAPEGARLYLERETARGRTVGELRKDLFTLQRSIKDMQLEVERGLRAEDCIFLDTAVPSCLAWYRYFGMDPNEFLPECFHHRYASVFLLDPLPLQPDGLRYKDAELQGFIDAWNERDFRALGYAVRRVPVLPPEERLRFVLRVFRGG